MSFSGGWNFHQGNKYRVCFEKAYGSDMAWKSQQFGYLVIGGRVFSTLGRSYQHQQAQMGYFHIIFTYIYWMGDLIELP